MRTSDFDFKLPAELIAQHPLPRREESRMLVVERSSGSIWDRRFRDLPDYLRPGDVLVLNDTRVIPARLWGKAAGRDVEFLFIREVKPGAWEVLCRPAKSIKLSQIVDFDDGFSAAVTAVGEEGLRTLDFGRGDIGRLLDNFGFAPLPPYIKRDRRGRAFRDEDLRRYQTVFARQEGSIAAPTAGLHFTPAVLEAMAAKGIVVSFITLHVGLATFQPIRADRVEEHRMLEESYVLSPETAKKINAAKRDQRPVVAVGTTVVRALESAAGAGGVAPGPGRTRLFIRPGYGFRVVDRMLTNFHLPRSSLLMLVSALAGRELILRAYHHAVAERYRFFSYGDCMLVV